VLQALAIAPTQGRLGHVAPEPLQRAIAGYLETACRPFLSLSADAIPDLYTHIRRCAVAGHDARTAMLAHLGAWLSDMSDDERTSLMSAFGTATGEIAGRAEGLFHPDAAGCLTMGVRATHRAMRRVLVNESRVAAALEAGAETGVTRALAELTSWLDLATSSVLWFVQDSAAWMQFEVAQAACLAVKLLGVRYAAALDVALKPADLVREGRAHPLSGEDASHDTALARANSAALLRFIDAAPDWPAPEAG